MHNKHVTVRVGLVFLGLWLVMPLLLAFGQTAVLSDILGQLNDGSGAAIPGATVTVANQNTGFTRTVTSDSSGAYLINNLVSGLYAVTVEKAGFKKYVRTDLDLTASKQLRIDVTLEIGQIAQTITVKGETPLIETETSAISTGEGNAVINDLPEAGSSQGGRIAYTFFYYVPGSTSSVGQSSFNGLPSGSGAARITLDGVRVAESCCQQLPSLEAIAEIKVATQNAPAEYKTPSVVELITRQGANKIYGDVWGLYDDKSLQARDPFFSQKALFHGWTFGGSVGGPIKKNKAFFYFGFEGFRFANLSVTTSPITQYNVPTAKMQQGDFSELLDPAWVNQLQRGSACYCERPTHRPALHR